MDDTESILEGARSILARTWVSYWVRRRQAWMRNSPVCWRRRRRGKGGQSDPGLLANYELTRELDTHVSGIRDQAEARVAFVKSYGPTPGDPDPIAAERYICPINGDTVWFRQDVGETVPAVPRLYHIRLVKV